MQKLDLELSRTSGNNVGTYSITANTMNSNFDLTVNSGTYTISEREISVTYSGYTGLTYNGQAHNILAVATNLADGDLLQLAGHDASDAGTYTATAYVYKDGVDVSNNYQITDQSIEYTIAKRTITASLLETEYEYTGQDVDLEVSFTGLISGDDLYVTIMGGGQSAGTHIVNVELNGDDQDNYELLNNEFTITITQGTLQLESNVDKVISDMQVFEYNYLNNNTTIENATLLEILGLSHLSSQINNPVFTGLDLSNGASTFIVEVTIPESTNYKSLETTFILKLKTVWVDTGANPTYYTIEDALLNTSSGTLVVRYHTSFAQSDVANTVYGTNNFDLESGVTLLLPYNSAYSANIEDTGTANTSGLTKNSPFVELNVPSHITIDISGTLTVNAQYSGGTPHSGFIVGSNYAQIHMEVNSKLIVGSGGRINSNGFIYGEGKVDALSGSNIYEVLYIHDFRGGSITSDIYGETFPFDQYSFNNIEVELTLNYGSNLFARAVFYARAYSQTSFKVIGEDGALINMTDSTSKIIKSYNSESGTITFDFYGKIIMRDISLTMTYILPINLSTKEKEFPFPGNFKLNVKNGAEFILDMGIKMLPGSTVNIEQGANVKITENGRLMIYDGNEYLETRNYPINLSEIYSRYRVAPEFIHNKTTPSILNIDGVLEVYGGIAGKLYSSNETGQIKFANPQTSLTIKSVVNGSINTTRYSLKHYNKKHR